MKIYRIFKNIAQMYIIKILVEFSGLFLEKTFSKDYNYINWKFIENILKKNYTILKKIKTNYYKKY